MKGVKKAYPYHSSLCKKYDAGYTPTKAKGKIQVNTNRITLCKYSLGIDHNSRYCTSLA